MNRNPLRYYMHDGPAAVRFELAGNLDREGARRLAQDRRVASSVIGNREVIADMTYVIGTDEDGRRLLVRWRQGGARLIAISNASRTLAESIVGGPLPAPRAQQVATAAYGAWLPFQSSFLASAVMLWLLFASLAFPIGARAATLKAESIDAWEDYLRGANANLQDRVRPGGKFLWAFEDPTRAARARSGEIVTAPAPGPNPTKVPGGLIHHWMGAMFLPSVKLDEVLEVTQDYDRYKDFYRPSVMASKTLARNGPEDRISMVLMNKAFFLKTALDADYQATNVRLDDRRFYSITKTTRVQEIEEYGRPGEHRTPEGEGGGYIWKLYSVVRLEERDGGVYLELEAIALTRDVPVALRFVVDPIVRRVSRNSILTTLQQTGEAVRGNGVTSANAARGPVGGFSFTTAR